MIPGRFRGLILDTGEAMERFTLAHAEEACRLIGVDLTNEAFDASDVLAGMLVELEHGTRTPELDVTGDDATATAKIALAHLREFPDYYERLERMEALGAAAWAVAEEGELGIV